MLRADFKIHNNKPVHHIKVISDLAEPVWSPYFSIQENGQVFEFPHGDSHSHQLRWYYEVWDEKQNNVAPNSLLCRVHANISDFADSVFNRVSVQWNALFEVKLAKPFNVVVPAETFVCMPEGGTVFFFNTSNFIMTKRENISDAFKEHFKKLLLEFQQTSWITLPRK